MNEAIGERREGEYCCSDFQWARRSFRELAGEEWTLTSYAHDQDVLATLSSLGVR